MESGEPPSINFFTSFLHVAVLAPFGYAQKGAPHRNTRRRFLGPVAASRFTKGWIEF